jgi:hypothetical protein
MKYLRVPTIPYISNDSGFYESEQISSIVTPCSGVEPVGMSRGYSPVWRDFSHVGEPKNNTFGYTSSTIPFGWDTLFAHCRKGYPFMMYTSGSGRWELYYLREGDFKPKRMISDYDDLYEIPIKAIYAGYWTI